MEKGETTAMVEKIKKLFKDKEQQQELLLYILMGIATTVLNYLVYYGCVVLFGIRQLEPTSVDAKMLKTLSNSIAWILSVAFAYVTNRKFVFKSNTKGGKAIAKEMGMFVGGRLLSYVLFDVAFFYLFVNVLYMNDFVVKLVANVGVIVFNYVVGKMIVFKKNNPVDKQREE
ncbi:MAG: GtrA family protein [Clostridiales bacterium]|nr:GtrA family protein [Clostridiales bacterium]